MHSSIVIGEWKGFLGGQLAPRELEAMLHCANNLTVKEAALKMNISPSTVTKRLLAAKYKLGVSSLRAVILEAMRRGLISYTNGMAPFPDQPHQDQDQDQEATNGVFVA